MHLEHAFEIFAVERLQDNSPYAKIHHEAHVVRIGRAGKYEYRYRACLTHDLLQQGQGPVGTFPRKQQNVGLSFGCQLTPQRRLLRKEVQIVDIAKVLANVLEEEYVRIEDYDLRSYVASVNLW
jgi:hypothetical protein